ncbi:MAG TPA: hypothetical protein VJT78_13505 [Candidatus Dormibacteraeota bacterium]|nr:hypothetical protein [Candidatus Dormibacteraeota bacterium]
MLEALVGTVVGLLIIAGVLILIGPSNLRDLLRRARSIQRPTRVPAVFQAAGPRELAAPGLNPKTQRVLVGAARLATWLRSHSHDDLARELRGAAARMTANEPAGLYAMQTLLRKVKSVGAGDTASQERLATLANELRVAVQDRFEQLELLPFKKP